MKSVNDILARIECLFRGHYWWISGTDESTYPTGAVFCAYCLKRHPTEDYQKVEPEYVYLRLIDAGTDNECWVICVKGDRGAVRFVRDDE